MSSTQPSGETFAEYMTRLRETVEKNREKFTGVAAEGVDFDLFAERLIQSVAGNDRLRGCNIASLCGALRDSCVLGLPIGSQLGHGYAVPRKGVASFQVGYLGLQKLAYDSPLIAGVTTETVCDGDEIEIHGGTEPGIKHKIATHGRGNPIGFYAVVFLVSGVNLFRYMTVQQVETHRNKFAKGFDRGDSAWKSSFEAMARKTCLVAAMKHAPLHSDAARIALNNEERPEPEGFKSGDKAPAADLDAALEADDRTPAQLDEPPADWEPSGEPEFQSDDIENVF